MTTMTKHPVVAHDAWIAARTAFLQKEKAFTKLRDELSRQRRDLPWERVEKTYTFVGPNGEQTLADLFGPRRQLIVYHFMFSPTQDAGCKHCSFWADNFDAAPVHLAHRDISFAAISRAPVAKLEAFKQRMGWSFTWVSSGDSDFNYDYQASFRPEDLANGDVYFNYRFEKMDMRDREGVSVFFKDDDGAIYHTYSCYARGIDLLNGTYNFIDLTPKGRDEGDAPQSWVRHHDRYDA
jgi:predicted dithiol-disulfide oxidoreductase (DUF899 family)